MWYCIFVGWFYWGFILIFLQTWTLFGCEKKTTATQALCICLVFKECIVRPWMGKISFMKNKMVFSLQKNAHVIRVCWNCYRLTADFVTIVGAIQKTSCTSSFQHSNDVNCLNFTVNRTNKIGETVFFIKSNKIKK